LKKISIISLLTTFLIISFSTHCLAGWLIYNKPEYRGRIIDAETKKPIEGAVVVAIYQKYPIISGPAGGSTSIIHIKEALTDEKGEFHIPSYTTLIGPNSIEDDTDFIIYKPGHGRYPSHRARPPHVVSPEKLFTKEIGTKGEIYLRKKTVFFIYGVVELPPLKTWEERRRGLPGYPSDFTSKKVPLFFKAINEERKKLGFSGKVK